MTFAGAVATCFNKYAKFRGVASRPEFWYWRLFAFLASIVASTGDTLLAAKTGSLSIGGTEIDPSLVTPVSSILALAIALPDLAVTVRRLHDGGHSGHWVWLNFVPVIFAIPVIGAYLEYMRTRITPQPDVFLLGCMIGSLVSFFAVVALQFTFLLQPTKAAGNRFSN